MTINQVHSGLKFAVAQETNADIVRGLFVDNGYDGLRAADTWKQFEELNNFANVQLNRTRLLSGSMAALSAY